MRANRVRGRDKESVSFFQPKPVHRGGLLAHREGLVAHGDCLLVHTGRGYWSTVVHTGRGYWRTVVNRGRGYWRTVRCAVAKHSVISGLHRTKG